MLDNQHASESDTLRLRPVREQLPLCVRVYDEILESLQRSGLQPGDEIPGEVQLASELRVSRTVTREALLLLEEDGFLRRHRGRRRTLAHARSQSVGFNADLKALLGLDELTPVSRLQARIVPATAFTREHLHRADDLVVWETTLESGGRYLGSSLEFIPLGLAPVQLLDSVADGAVLGESADSLLSAIGPGRRARWTPFLWRFSLVSHQTERMAWMALPRAAVPSMLTVGLAERGQPIYLAKHLLDLAQVSVTVDLLKIPTATQHERAESGFVSRHATAADLEATKPRRHRHSRAATGERAEGNTE